MKDIHSSSISCAVHYQGCIPTFFREVFSQVDLDFETSVFLDFGCGKGRALVMASDLGFRKIIGIEFSTAMCAMARENTERFASRFAKQTFEIVESDCLDYVIGNDVNVFYFFNPFSMVVMKQVLNNILSSVSDAPRKIWIIYLNPVQDEAFNTDGLLRVSHKPYCYSIWRNV